MKIGKHLLVILGLITVTGSFAQQDSTFRFNLDEAIDYGLESNRQIKNARLDITQSRKKVWETTAMGLPHASASAGYSYMITVPEQIEQFNMIGNLFGYMYQDNPQLATQLFGEPTDGGEESNTDDLRESITLDVQVNQLLFSGPYIVGLQAAKTYKQLSKQNYERTENQVKENITNSYVLVLVTRENKIILDSSYQSTQKMYHEFQKMYEQGFVEQTDVQQHKLTLQNIKSAQLQLQRQLELAEKTLKLQMGIDLEQHVELTDSLNALVGNMRLDVVLNQEFDLKENINYQLLQTQETLAELDLKRKRSEALPNISAYYTHHEEFNDQAFSFTPPDLVGLSVNIPIFSSLERTAKVNQAKIELEKTRNSNKEASDGLILQYKQSRSNYINAIDQYDIQKENITLSKNIYDHTIEKYKQGTTSSLELTQAQSQYLTAQRNYYNAIIQLVKAKLSLDKILNNL